MLAGLLPMKKLNQTESPIVVLFCVFFVSKGSSLTFFVVWNRVNCLQSSSIFLDDCDLSML